MTNMGSGSISVIFIGNRSTDIVYLDSIWNIGFYFYITQKCISIISHSKSEDLLLRVIDDDVSLRGMVSCFKFMRWSFNDLAKAWNNGFLNWSARITCVSVESTLWKGYRISHLEPFKLKKDGIEGIISYWSGKSSAIEFEGVSARVISNSWIFTRDEFCLRRQW